MLAKNENQKPMSDDELFIGTKDAIVYLQAINRILSKAKTPKFSCPLWAAQKLDTISEFFTIKIEGSEENTKGKILIYGTIIVKELKK